MYFMFLPLSRDSKKLSISSISSSFFLSVDGIIVDDFDEDGFDGGVNDFIDFLGLVNFTDFVDFVDSVVDFVVVFIILSLSIFADDSFTKLLLLNY